MTSSQAQSTAQPWLSWNLHRTSTSSSTLPDTQVAHSAVAQQRAEAKKQQLASTTASVTSLRKKLGSLQMLCEKMQLPETESKRLVGDVATQMKNLDALEKWIETAIRNQYQCYLWKCRLWGITGATKAIEQELMAAKSMQIMEERTNLTAIYQDALSKTQEVVKRRAEELAVISSLGVDGSITRDYEEDALAFRRLLENDSCSLRGLENGASRLWGLASRPQEMGTELQHTRPWTELRVGLGRSRTMV